MDATLVKQLARRDPTAEPNQGSELHHQLNNPAFGWHIACAFARARVRFPITVLGRDHWLFHAYWMLLNPNGPYAPEVLEAYNLSDNPAKSATLKAMLIAGLGDPIDAHLDAVAGKAGVGRRTVEAFEILFFNVLDRHLDALYLSNIVYPDGRSVEMDEEYFETEPVGNLILRAAYNYRDIDLPAHLAGMGDAEWMAELEDLRVRENELHGRFMGNALLLAGTGMLNQRGVGLQRATPLLAASSKGSAQRTGDG